MNSAQLLGRLTNDPDELRRTEHGTVTSFRIAVSRASSSSKAADFFTIEVWDRLAEACASYLSRGREVAIEGRIEHREWRTADNERQERIVVVARSVDFLRRPQPGAAHTSSAAEDIPF